MNTAFIVGFGRWVLPIIAFYVIVGCGISLVRGNKKTGTIGYLINSANGDRIPLTSYETSIGRSNACDIVLSYNTVSRFHAVIAKRGGKWYIFDTNSKTGTFVSGEKIDDVNLTPHELMNGDAIIFGNALFTFLDHLPKSAEPMPEEKENPNLFFGDNKWNTGEIFIPSQIKRGCKIENCITKDTISIDQSASVLIGRGNEADIRIASPAVSRNHALLSRVEDGWIIEDLESNAGTLLNGVPVTECTPIGDGDIIEICGFTLKFVED